MKEAYPEDLVRHAQQGNQQAFSSLVRRYQQMVFRYCYSMLTNRQDAEDIVQETFIKAYRHLQRYQEEGNFIGWLMTIAHRLCLNKLKKEKRKFSLLQKMIREHQDPPADLIIHEERMNEEIFQLLNQLKPKQRAIVILKVIQGFNYEEISKILHENPTNLRKQYERAKKKLQQKNVGIHTGMKGDIYYEYSQSIRATNK